MRKYKYVKHQKKMKLLFLFSIILFLYISKKHSNKITIDESKIFTTWATGIHPARSTPIKLNGNSLRQILKITAPGQKIRIKLSNQNGDSKLEIKKACIANVTNKNETNGKSMKYFKFNGKRNIIIEKGEEFYSDPIFYPLEPSSEIAISLYFGMVPNKLSGHNYSTTYSYIEKGNKIKKRIFTNKYKVEHWYFISAIEVISDDEPKKTIVCFGDSITDGVVFYNNERANYPDLLYDKLLKNNMGDIAVVNEGINAERITEQGIQRFDHEVLDIKGIGYIIVLYGVNDLNVLNSTSKEIIEGYREIIEKARIKNILIYAGTIIPFSDYNKKYLWNKNKEKVRKEVNNWIKRTKPKNGGFDSYFDFDKYLKDPKNETRMNDIYDSGDGIHPGLEGSKKMVELINLDLFSK